MKNKKFKKFVAKSALPLILGGGVILAGAAGSYYYMNNKDDKVDVSSKQPAQTEVQEKGNNLETNETTSPPAAESTINSTDVGDASLSITIDDPSPGARNTATVSFYGPAGTFGVEKLVNGSWTTTIARFSYSGAGGRGIDTITSNATETHYRVFSLSGDTKTATSGDTVVKWSLVNENGIYTIPVAR